MSQPTTHSDRARQYIASLNGCDFTAAELMAALDGYRYTSSILTFFCEREEIKRSDEKRGSGNYATYRATDQLRATGLPPRAAATIPSPKPAKPRTPSHNHNEANPMTPAEREWHERANCLQAALDARTRNREASHA